MTEYVITVCKREKNPEYDPKKDYDPINYRNYPAPLPYLEYRELYVVLTEDEFKAVKKACLEVM